MKLSNFVLTGTGVYGPTTPGESDIDIVIMKEDVEKLKEHLTALGVIITPVLSTSNYSNASFYYQLGGLRFNIIQTEIEQDLEHWKNRTERMKGLAPIEDRETRLLVFNGKSLSGAKYIVDRRKGVE